MPEAAYKDHIPIHHSGEIERSSKENDTLDS